MVGESGIRTLGTRKGITRFQVVLHKPLGQLSIYIILDVNQVEQVTGLEPVPQHWQCRILTNYTIPA